MTVGMKSFFLKSLFVGCLALLASCAPTRDLSTAPQGDQNIVVWHSASGERIDVTTRSNGSYNPSAFEKIDRIFRDRQSGDEYPIDPKLIDALTELRDKLMMSPSDPIELLSGYRSSDSNTMLARVNKNAAKNSYHMKGQAADIRIPDMNSSALEAVAKTMQKGGVALYPDSGHVHVDTGPVRGWSVIRGREAGVHESRRSSSSSSSSTRFSAPVIKPVLNKLKGMPKGHVRPLNSYDGLPEPSVKADPTVYPVTKPVVPPLSSKPSAKETKSKQSVETAKKQWVKTPAPKMPSRKDKSKKEPIKKHPAKRDVNE